MRRVLLLALFLCATVAFAQPSRHFTFRYEVTVKAVEQGKPLRVWIPLAHSDAFQTVIVKSATGDLPLRRTRERQYGDQMLYATTARAARADYHFVIDYDIVRREATSLTAADRLLSEDPAAVTPTLNYVSARQTPALRRFLLPDKLVPTSGVPAQIAVQQVGPRAGELQRARALYDYVLATMRYDKSGTGWGRGDTLWACDAKRGNCTDFHSLFISMARSQRIPARFEIGFPLPAAKHEGEIPGYHCWAEFYLFGKGWIPMDISEAWKDPSRREYFFGALDTDRVQFTIGRDVVLEPPQAGEPLNYFVYPYVEVAGKQHENVLNSFSFRDVQ
jgi:transglutaminase-like putative cysteine protease